MSVAQTIDSLGRPLHRRHGLEYSADDLKVLRAWYFEREAGYPNLKKFEGGANWPAESLAEYLRRTCLTRPRSANKPTTARS